MSSEPIKPVGISPQSRAEFANDPTVHTRILQNNTQNASRTASAAWGAQLAPASDPFGKLVGYVTGFQDSGRICIGWIMDGTAIANAYRVHLEKGTCPIMATAVSHTSQGFVGATEINTYMPGTCVIVMVHDKNRYGYILGAIPDVLDTSRRAMHPYITQASRKRVDDCHKRYIKQPGSSDIGNWNAWRPYDATHASEWGAISTTGLAVTLDDFMVQLSVNEFCGVYGFYHDSLLRIAGHSFQTWTAGHEREAIMDQAEYNDYQGYNAYPWEAMGVMKRGTEVIKEYQPETYQCPQGRPYYAHWESKNAYQQPYHRTQWFFGYLGQGQRHVLHAPPEGVDIWTYMKGPEVDEGDVYESDIDTSEGSKPPCSKGGDKDYTEMELKPCMGFHEDNVSMDGRRFIASAKGVIIAKRMLLPMPTRIRRMEDPLGDDAEKNYKAAGVTGAGPDHIITGDVGTDGEHPHLQRTGGVLDLHGYLFNYVGLHPFHWHTKDYKLWEQSELEYAKFNHTVPTFNILKSQMYLPQPQPKQLKVDERYGKQNFYEAECYISLLDDGSVLIGDGYGAEIKMCAGCLTLSAPGDVWIKSGRSSQIWSGADCIIRAVDDIDMSTTDKNIRIKSEQNIMMLAGNDSSKKEGGVLIESRARSPIYKFEQCGDDVIFGGIVFRAPKSEIVGLAKNVYFRTGGGGSKTIEKGMIMLDAGRGESEIVTKSNMFYQFVGQRGQIFHFFRDATEDLTRKGNSFSRDATVICGPLLCDKDFISDGNALLNGSVICADKNSHIFTGAAAKGLIFVAPCDDECQSIVKPVLDMVKEYLTKILPELGDRVEREYLYPMWYQDGRPGNAYIMDIMEFSFRTDEQYKVPDFLVMEDRWQQMARLYTGVPKTWTEKKVTNVSCGETWPFPGKKWFDAPCFGMVDFGIAENAGGGIRDTDRGAQGTLSGPYKNPKYKPITKQKLNGLYPIVGRD